MEKTLGSLRELNSKLMKRLDDCEKRPQHFTGTSLPMSLEERINTIIEQKLERVVDQKIEQRFQQLEPFLEQGLSQITNAMTEKFGNIGTTIFKVGEAVDTLTNTISSLGSSADESDRRLATLKKTARTTKKEAKAESGIRYNHSYPSQWRAIKKELASNSNSGSNSAHDAVQQHGLTLWNDPQLPTRVGNSVSRDTSPDLTFSFGIWQHCKTPLKTAKRRSQIGPRAGSTTSQTYKTPESARSKSLTRWPNTQTVKLSVDHPEVDPRLASHVEGQKRPSKVLEKAEKKPQTSASYCRFD
ncbi:hypothetical protein HPB50_003330 [Hyalomma asiaticum]|uniref:Uncharacterized protein n=1 Tax=Hyalomma asiaticum TaxID=266040 RepID=A0ACB7S4S1_HYAAI|nr:hypothetical protein HPB50_003330 [Hyalomma asiaticum]